MISGIIKRLFIGAFLLSFVLVYDSYIYIQSNLMIQVVEDENGDEFEEEVSLADAVKSFVTDINKPLGELSFVFNGKTLNTDSIWEDDDGKEYVLVDEDGNDTEDEDGTAVYGTGSTYWKEVLQSTIIKKYKLYYLIIVFVVLGAIWDLIKSMREKGAPERAKKASQKEGKKLVESLKSLQDKQAWKKILKIMEDPIKKGKIPVGELDQFDKAHGLAFFHTGNQEKAIPILKKFALKEKDDAEVLTILGKYLSENTSQARVQDLPSLVSYINNNDIDEDFGSFFSKFVMKYKISDRSTLSGLCKICGTPWADDSIRKYTLECLVKFESTDDLAIEFYTNCKKATPDDPKPVMMLAEANMSNGKFSEALSELEILLSLDYENQRLHEMLFTIYQLREGLADLYAIYSSILEQYPNEAIAVAAQRKIMNDPTVNAEQVDQRQNMSLQELLAMRKDGDSSADQDIMKKYEKNLTIMFTDIKGYTSMTESQSIVETMGILQESDEIVPPIIEKHEGVIIKKIGDAYMARFESSDSAVIAGIQIQQAIWKNNKQRESDGKIRWEIRMGLNTGNVILKDGDVFGDAVNIAARVESAGEANKVYCTEDTKNDVANSKLEFEAKDVRQVKGKSEGIQLYSVVFDIEGA